MADCQFHPEAIKIWADRKNVRLFSDAEREDAYLRAVPFFLEQMKALIEMGWTQKFNKPNDNGILFDLSHYGEDRLALPSTFSAFLDGPKEDTWSSIFTNSWLFFAAWNEEDDMDLFMESSAPLCNIFYLLQVLAPGMLVIHREEAEDIGRREISRVLPRKSWIEEHYDLIEEVMGNNQAMQALLGAAEDQNIAYDQPQDSKSDIRSSDKRSSDKRSDTDSDQEDFYDYYDDEDDSGYYVDSWEAYDFTACSSEECGWCGRCYY